MKSTWQLIRWSVFALAAFLLSQDMCLWSAPKFLHQPSLFILFAGDFVTIALLAAIPASVVFAVRAIMNWRDRRAMLSCLGRMAVCLLFSAAYIGGVQWTSERRTAAFARAAANGASLIDALAAYHTVNGKYPTSLNQLIPEYTSAIPWTGLIGYPEFTYHNGFNDISAVADSYELRINCSSGGINFDRFIYWPSETYPQRIQDNRTEEIGTWVYVHE